MTVSKMPIVDTNLIPNDGGRRIFCATLEAIRRVQRDMPNTWAKIEVRADELRAPENRQN